MRSAYKTETIEEFLARGGEIKKYPAVKPEENEECIRATPQSTQNLMSLDEGAHFFSERKEKKLRKKKDPLKGIDVSKLPANIKAMFNL